MPRRNLFFALACLPLAACADVKDTASQGLDTVGTETSASVNKMRNYLGIGHAPKPVAVKDAQSRYCYKTYQDIICYSRPLPGEEYRLVGFQTAAGKTGYVLSPAMMPEGEGDALPPLKSVTVIPPPPIKGDDGGKQLKEIIFDPSELQPKELVPDKPQ